jgi:hypothetical protein
MPRVLWDWRPALFEGLPEACAPLHRPLVRCPRDDASADPGLDQLVDLPVGSYKVYVALRRVGSCGTDVKAVSPKVRHGGIKVVEEFFREVASRR